MQVQYGNGEIRMDVVHGTHSTYSETADQNQQFELCVS